MGPHRAGLDQHGLYRLNRKGAAVRYGSSFIAHPKGWAIVKEDPEAEMAFGSCSSGRETDYLLEFSVHRLYRVISLIIVYIVVFGFE